MRVIAVILAVVLCSCASSSVIVTGKVRASISADNVVIYIEEPKNFIS